GFTGATGGLNAQHDIQTWTFTPTVGSGIDHSAGFASHSDLTANGNASFPTGTTVARLTAAQNGQTGSIFANSRVDITNFTTTFPFQISAGSNLIADGLTFTIQAQPGGVDFGDSVLKLSTNGGLTRADFFTPFNQADLDRTDADLASGGVMLLPDQPGPF